MKIVYEAGDRVRIKATGAVATVEKHPGDWYWPVYTTDGSRHAPEEIEPDGGGGGGGPGLEPVVVTGDAAVLKCPHCGAIGLANFRYVEDIRTSSELRSLDGGRLYIAARYEAGDDDGANPRLRCESCGGDCVIPDGLECDFR